MKFPKYIEGYGIWYSTILGEIKKKSHEPLQPLFEAFTNAIKSIRILNSQDPSKKIRDAEIIISIYLTSGLLSQEDGKYEFQKFIVKDTGVGFNDTEWNRFITLKDNRKNFNNKGTGRIQYLHFFDNTKIISQYKNDNYFFERVITLSKCNEFLNKNAIIRLDKQEKINNIAATGSQVVFERPLMEKDGDYYSQLSSKSLKNDLIHHYLVWFCENRNNLPRIGIQLFHDGKMTSTDIISDIDIPKPDKQTDIQVFYRQLNTDNLEKAINSENFIMRIFKISDKELLQNQLYLTSKGEIAQNIDFYSINPKESIENNKFLCLLSSLYIDARDSDVRGNIYIPSLKELRRKGFSSELFEDKIVVLDDIEFEANNKLCQLYPEISVLKQKKLII